MSVLPPVLVPSLLSPPLEPLLPLESPLEMPVPLLVSVPLEGSTLLLETGVPCAGGGVGSCETNDSGSPRIKLAERTRATRPTPTVIVDHSGNLGISHPPPPPPSLPLPCGPEPPPGSPKNRSRLCRLTAAPAQSPSDSLMRSASERSVCAVEPSSRQRPRVPDWCKDHASAALSPSSLAAWNCQPSTWAHAPHCPPM